MAIKEIIATQGQNVRARGSRTYHLVVSFPLGERPAPERLRDIEDELCKAIGRVRPAENPASFAASTFRISCG